jgi:hypothetical protein
VFQVTLVLFPPSGARMALLRTLVLPCSTGRPFGHLDTVFDLHVFSLTAAAVRKEFARRVHHASCYLVDASLYVPVGVERHHGQTVPEARLGDFLAGSRLRPPRLVGGSDG